MDVLGSIDQPLKIVIKSDRLLRYQQAAEATNHSLRTITQSGETCDLVDGGSYILPDGKIEVEIGGSDLSDFWRIVEECE
jgi:hypothetical protein